MTHLESFTQDHLLIVRVLDALAVFTRNMSETGQFDRGGLHDFATFFTGFADVHHSSKEEQVLFPTLERHGARWEHGPLADARREHRQERYFIRTLSQLANQHSEPDREDVRHLVVELAEFERSMRDHMKKEDDFVLPLAAEMDEAARADLERRLLEFDETPPSHEDVPKMQELAGRLIASYR